MKLILFKHALMLQISLTKFFLVLKIFIAVIHAKYNKDGETHLCSGDLPPITFIST